MKKILLLSIFALGLLLTIESCKDDDPAPQEILITSHRKTGKFYKLDLTTGAKTEAFDIKLSGNTLNELRGFVYHPKKDLFYASASSYVDQDNPRNGFLYSIVPSTKVATVINSNNGKGGAYAIWDAVVNWAVASDDSLVSVGDFNGDGSGIVKFGTDGGRSKKTTEVDFCCGLGLIYDATAKTMLVTNDPNDGTVEILTITQATGAISNTLVIDNLIDFPKDVSTDWLPVKAMAKAKDGMIYALMFNSDEADTYLIKIDIANKKATYIATLGTDNANQYNLLAFVPENKL